MKWFIFSVMLMTSWLPVAAAGGEDMKNNTDATVLVADEAENDSTVYTDYDRRI